MVDPEESFDVVDQQDRVVQSLPRKEVHRLGLRHRAVHIFVFRSAGQLLIHRRSPSKEEFPDVWTSSASGHVSAGEDYDVAAPRELLEELGIGGQLERLARFSACPETSNEFTVLYRIVSDASIHHDPHEIAEIRWETMPAIQQWLSERPDDFSPAFRMLFDWFMINQQQQQQ